MAQTSGHEPVHAALPRPSPQAWKRQRLVDLGLGIPSFLRLVPVDFEAGDAWWERLAASGFDLKGLALLAYVWR